MSKALKNKDREKKQSKMKRIREKGSKEGCVSTRAPNTPGPTFLSAFLSCVLSASPITAQLAPVRFSNN
jgi:hypothetical protein